MNTETCEDSISWFEEKREAYEGYKDIRHLVEYPEAGGFKVSPMEPDHPRYQDGHRPALLIKFERYLILRKEIDDMRKDLIVEGW